MGAGGLGHFSLSFEFGVAKENKIRHLKGACALFAIGLMLAHGINFVTWWVRVEGVLFAWSLSRRCDLKLSLYPCTQGLRCSCILGTGVHGMTNLFWEVAEGRESDKNQAFDLVKLSTTHPPNPRSPKQAPDNSSLSPRNTLSLATSPGNQQSLMAIEEGRLLLQEGL